MTGIIATARPKCKTHGQTVPRGLDELAARGLPVPSREPTLRDVVRAAARAAALPRDEIIGRSLFKWITGPRQAAMWVAYHTTHKSFPDIGRGFGGRDHTTVMHAVRVVTERIDAGNTELLELCAGIIRCLQTPAADLPTSRSVALVPVEIDLARTMPTQRIERLRQLRWSVGSISRFLDLPPHNVADYLGVQWSLDGEASL